MLRAGDLSGRSVFSLPHRAEALCFARAGFQPGRDGRLSVILNRSLFIGATFNRTPYNHGAPNELFSLPRPRRFGLAWPDRFVGLCGMSTEAIDAQWPRTDLPLGRGLETGPRTLPPAKFKWSLRPEEMVKPLVKD